MKRICLFARTSGNPQFIWTRCGQMLKAEERRWTTENMSQVTCRDCENAVAGQT